MATFKPDPTKPFYNRFEADNFTYRVQPGSQVGTDPVRALWEGHPGTSWNMTLPGTPAVITYSLSDGIPSGYGPLRGAVQPFDAIQAANIRLALSRWQDVSGLRFVEVPASVGGDMRFTLYTPATGEQARSYAYFPVVTPQTVRDFSGDIWAWPGSFSFWGSATYDPGTQGFQFLMHEIGHALGLKHPWEGGYTLPLALDTPTNTIMSTQTGTLNRQTVLGPYDIQAIQHLYGTPQSEAGMGISRSWDADRLVLTSGGDGRGQVLVGINLSDVMDAGAGDDLLFGQAGNDSLSGGTGNDQLFGGEGNDTLIAGGGHDHVEGGPGTDLAIVDFASAGVRVGRFDDGSVALGGGRSTVLLKAVETVRFADGVELPVASLTSNSAVHAIYSSDMLPPRLVFGDTRQATVATGAGEQVLRLGEGAWTLTLSGVEHVVSSRAGHAATTLDAPAPVQGGDGDDRLAGGALADTILAGAGRDRILPGPGDDSVDGGAGTDAVRIAARFDQAIITHADGVMTIVSPDGVDRLAGVEIVQFDDRIVPGWDPAGPALGGFDEALYLAANPDVAEAVRQGTHFASGRDHYIAFGHKEGRADQLLVHETWYLATYPEVARAVAAGAYRSGQEHFVLTGWAAGFDPHPLFDGAWYTARYQPAQVLAGTLSPFQHFIRHGGALGYDPHPLFDSSAYRDANWDLADIGLAAVSHWLEHGAREGRAAVPADSGWFG